MADVKHFLKTRKVVHDYLGVDLDRIWDIVEDNPPTLKKRMSAVLEEKEA